jgi:hypothetical protein
MIKIKILKKKKAQVWVESVVYVGIMLALIGLVLAVVKPEIEKRTNEAIIDQAEMTLKEMDFLTQELEFRGEGNSRFFDLNVRRGEFKIIPQENKIVFEMKTNHAHSQPEQEFSVGAVKTLTSEISGGFLVRLSIDYDNKKITFNEKKDSKVFFTSKNPYTLLISNTGIEEGKTKINIELM